MSNELLEIFPKFRIPLKALHLGPAHPEIVAEMGKLTELISLEELGLLNFGQSITDEVIKIIGLSCRNIKRLKMFFCREVTIKGLSNFASALPVLEELQLNDTKIINWYKENAMKKCPIFKAIKSMPNLKRLAMPFFYYKKDEDIITLISLVISRYMKFYVRDVYPLHRFKRNLSVEEKNGVHNKPSFILDVDLPYPEIEKIVQLRGKDLLPGKIVTSYISQGGEVIWRC